MGKVSAGVGDAEWEKDRRSKLLTQKTPALADLMRLIKPSRGRSDR